MNFGQSLSASVRARYTSPPLRVDDIEIHVLWLCLYPCARLGEGAEVVTVVAVFKAELEMVVK
jgi:hypothetical protein